MRFEKGDLVKVNLPDGEPIYVTFCHNASEEGSCIVETDNGSRLFASTYSLERVIPLKNDNPNKVWGLKKGVR